MVALKKLPGVIVRKRHGTVMGVAGDPDLYGAIRGRHFEIEVKRPDDPSSQLTKLQAERLLEWKMAGAIVGVARSVEEAKAILGLAAPARVRWICAVCPYTFEGPAAPDCCPACGCRSFRKAAA